MVPVPQELEAQVHQYLSWRLYSGEGGWSEESMAAFYEQLDEPSRVAVKMIASGVVQDEPVTVARIAQAAGTTARETLGIVLELVQRLRALGGPLFPFVPLETPEGEDDDQRPVVMPKDGARMALSIANRM
jgi:hypothetical protein